MLFVKTYVDEKKNIMVIFVSVMTQLKYSVCVIFRQLRLNKHVSILTIINSIFVTGIP